MKTWLVKMHCDGHTYNHGVITCEEEYVKHYCAALSEESEFDAYESEDPFPYIETYSYEEAHVITSPGTKFYYGPTLTVNGDIYINYKDKWWNVDIVKKYEDVPGNTCVEEVLEDMELDTDYNENLQYTKYEDTYLVDFIRG